MAKAKRLRAKRRDMAPFIAAVMCEHPPEGDTVADLVDFAARVWPTCTPDEIGRGVAISLELRRLDRLTRALA